MLLKFFRFSLSTVQAPATQTIKNIETSKQLLEKLQKQSNVVLSRDGYQVNIGVIIERKPIFLKANEVEMQLRKARFLMKKKYNLIPTVPKEIFDFPAKTLTRGIDEIPTHMREDPDHAGEKIYYHAKSKFYGYVDPDIVDPQSIQYQPCYHTYMMVKKTGSELWEFPWVAINEKQTMAEARQELLNTISNEQWTVQLKSVYPVVVHRVESGQSTQKTRIKGTKTFYFLANHLIGDVTTQNTWSGVHNWVPRGHLNKYVTKEVYDNFVGILSV